MTTKDIDQEIERLGNLDILVKTFEEIAATNIRKVRSSVVANRDFIEEIDKIFQELKATHAEEVLKLTAKKKNATTTSLMKHNGKTAAVFLAANTGLYGDVINKTFDLFLDYIQKNDVEAVVIGKLGMTMYQTAHLKKPALLFDLRDMGTNPEDLQKIVASLLPYEKILVFYGQYRSLVNQTPIVTDIYGATEQREQITIKKQHADLTHYLFEPSLERILAFFEAEIFASIFEQTVNESQLAKNASRMKLLDAAIQNIDVDLKKQQMNRRVMAHRAMNSKQLNSLAGLTLWSK